ncbi:hypothetical protein S58_34950 [Bradyrhizobium oligotrophicum S58]|uniref:Uncharacterized protein n=1 Tax=Bradyrhizobium oligotrophicum S58 TaxID=1245469 RepID=M4Z7E6_9BRAD|nr:MULTISPECIES: hypothetical protein [Bradyrhizobium]BAM89488.1 hypothetical protein S58_34950 [Bradyrhizobium oligotrophicum S58]
MINHSWKTSADELSAHPLAPQPEDAPLLALEQQFTELCAELEALDSLHRNRIQAAGEVPEQRDGEFSFGQRPPDEAATGRMETILLRLYPIEQEIIQTPASTIVGLGVKARHAAHVLSQYWEEDLDQIDWEAKAVRSLIEAVCEVAGVALPFHDSDIDE